ncbi:MAG: RNB domain-containing ribonuclease [Opitutae bacterium]|nr:RNB domain-containing ribonuclease [Opitutae bacterium]
MNLRDRLLAHLAEPAYRPANETTLLRQLALPKKQRAVLAHEVRRLLASGELLRVEGDRLKLRGAEGEITGHIRFRAGGSAFVVPDNVRVGDDDEAIQIASDDTDVALHGDRVAVRCYAHRQTRRDGRGTEATGRVLRVLERARETVVGTLQRAGRHFQILPDDPRLSQPVAVRDPAGQAFRPIPTVGDKVVVKLDPWLRRSDPITGEVTQRLGRTFEPRAELLGVYEKFNLDPKFPADVEREAAAMPDRVRPPDLVNRLDYRQVPTFTIDPDDAKDFDDALSLETLDHGEVRVGVHIADVSYYVRPGTALDREAQSRGNSTYLVGTVVPMLPERLSNGLCSLVEAENRLTKAVFLTFDRAGKLKATAYANTVIRSRKRLTYRQAYALMFENNLDRVRALPLPAKHQTGSTGRALSSLTDLELVDLQSWIRKLWAIARRLRTDRMAHGSLDLDMPETKIYVDAEGYADRLENVVHDESHQLVEEFMLAANEALARLTRSNKLPSLYRVHDEPDADKLSEYRKFVSTFGVHCGDLTKRSEAVKLLETLRTHPQGYVLRTQFLRNLRKACYRATADGHYGLNKKDYTHFTSPIRRYSDLAVHRVLEHYLIKCGGHPAPAHYRFDYDLPRLDALGEHLSLTETNSQEAERESQKIKLLEFFERECAKRQRTRFRAVITDVRANGFFIELVESKAFGLVPASALVDDNYVRNPDGSALVGRRKRKRFALGAELDVVVDKVDRYRRTLDFRPAD